MRNYRSRLERARQALLRRLPAVVVRLTGEDGEEIPGAREQMQSAEAAGYRVLALRLVRTIWGDPPPAWYEPEPCGITIAIDRGEPPDGGARAEP